MSQRSQVANSGSRPMEACSAACRAPPRISGLIRASSSWSSVTVHHTARVRRVRGGRSSLASPSTSPVISLRRRYETTWLVTSTEPKQSRAGPQGISVSVSRTEMEVVSRAVVEKGGLASSTSATESSRSRCFTR